MRVANESVWFAVATVAVGCGGEQPGRPPIDEEEQEPPPPVKLWGRCPSMGRTIL